MGTVTINSLASTSNAAQYYINIGECTDDPSQGSLVYVANNGAILEDFGGISAIPQIGDVLYNDVAMTQLFSVDPTETYRIGKDIVSLGGFSNYPFEFKFNSSSTVIVRTPCSGFSAGLQIVIIGNELRLIGAQPNESITLGFQLSSSNNSTNSNSFTLTKNLTQNVVTLGFGNNIGATTIVTDANGNSTVGQYTYAIAGNTNPSVNVSISGRSSGESIPSNSDKLITP